ncbi:MAG: lysylphosphatidylglycerol synthase domain-containing protein, partial [Candidatus Promineifilaceae bacterium]
PFIILPEFFGQPGPLLWLIPILSLLALIFFAFETETITRLVQKIAARLPDNWIQRPFRWMIFGLEGLAALRSGRTSLILVVLSAIIAVLSVLVPYVLFASFDFDLTLVQAALIHVVVTIAITPPSTPGKLGVFNGVVAIMLYSFGVSNDAAIISYSIIYYLVAIIPQITLGSLAAAKTDWQWQRTIEQQPST